MIIEFNNIEEPKLVTEADCFEPITTTREMDILENYIRIRQLFLDSGEEVIKASLSLMREERSPFLNSVAEEAFQAIAAITIKNKEFGKRD